MIRLILICLCTWFSITLPIHAQQYSKQEIQNLAVEHAEKLFTANHEEKIKGFANAIDSRVKIKPCDKDLSFTTPNLNNYSKNVTVRVRCLDAQGWSLYVPVKIKLTIPVVVASTTISKGDVLSRSQLKLVMVDKSYARKNNLNDLNMVIGSKAKQQILAGQAILNNKLCFVCKGELVTIEANTKGLSVKASGYALSDGSFGDVISVKNRSSNRIVTGRVTEIGKISISL